MTFYPGAVGLQSAQPPIAGTPVGEAPKCMHAMCATTGMQPGDPVEWVSEASRTAKLFDGTGTICGFAMNQKGLVSGAGIAVGDNFDIAYSGELWVRTGSALTVGAVFAGIANSVVRAVAVDGVQNLALVQFNMPARGPALP